MSGPVDKDTLIALAEARLLEAQTLVDRRLWSGAHYLAGYVVELALKACIANQFGARQIPDPKFVRSIFTHLPGELIVRSGLDELIKKDAAADVELDRNWRIVSDWREDCRYELVAKDRAEAMVRSVGDPKSGVLQWIRRHW
ncbi:MAG: hypothetical protein AB7K64_03210 [Variibacter sp.]